MKPIEGNRGPDRIAPLQNVQLLMQLIHLVCNPVGNETSWGCFYAPPGYGKSTAIAYAQFKFNAIVIEARCTWTPSAIIEALEKELSINPKKEAVYRRQDRVIESLSSEKRLIIFDEANHLVTKRLIEVLRETSWISHTPMVLVGTEDLKDDLKNFKVAATRVRGWLPGRPCNMDDAEQLTRMYGENIAISRDLTQHFLKKSDGVARIIKDNAEKARNCAVKLGVKEIDLRTFLQNETVFSGIPEDTWRGDMMRLGAIKRDAAA